MNTDTFRVRAISDLVYTAMKEIGGDILKKEAKNRYKKITNPKAKTALATIMVGLKARGKDMSVMDALYKKSCIAPGLPLPSGTYISDDTFADIIDNIPDSNTEVLLIGMEILPINEDITMEDAFKDDKLFLKKYPEQLQLIEQFQGGNISKAVRFGLAKISVTSKKQWEKVFGDVDWEKIKTSIQNYLDTTTGPIVNAISDGITATQKKVKKADKRLAKLIARSPKKQAEIDRRIARLKKFKR